MNTILLWQKVFSLSNGNTWVKIPEDLRKSLSLPHSIGICGGMLCTQESAKGINLFVSKLNAIGQQ